MSIEYLPVGIACNLKCDYCYQDPMRDAHNVTAPRDWEAAKAALRAENYKFTVFGGEALLTPIDHLEEVWQFGLENFGSNGVQTNGVLITEKHIEMFLKYKVHVGFSIDGPEELNKARATLNETRESIANLIKCHEAGVDVSLIVTLTRYNAIGVALQRLEAWVGGIKSYTRGIKYHILEVESDKVKAKLALTSEENITALSRLRKIQEHDLYTDARRLLLGEGDASCIWNGCDPLTTRAVRGVNADGTLANCGRTNKDGVNWQKADKESSERYFALYHTPIEFGGCKGCRFFAFCKGQCPGTAIDGDWRNRSEHCLVWYHILATVEQELLNEGKKPISVNLAALRALEEKVIRVHQVCEDGHGDAHGDTPHGDIPHGDAHGDIPHGDSHGDSETVSEGNGVEVTWRN